MAITMITIRITITAVLLFFCSAIYYFTSLRIQRKFYDLRYCTIFRNFVKSPEMNYRIFTEFSLLGIDGNEEKGYNFKETGD
ncbi:MAG: hypothetical protein V2A65_07200 [Candidatus Omnitrophota bacterium]